MKLFDCRAVEIFWRAQRLPSTRKLISGAARTLKTRSRRERARALV